MIVNAVYSPLSGFANISYFTLRSGGRTLITFMFDSVFTWGVSVTTACALAYMTRMPIVPLYLIVQSLEMIKAVIGFILVKKGVWVRNIVAAHEQEEAAC